MRFSRFVRAQVFALGAAGLLGFAGGCGGDVEKQGAPASDPAADKAREQNEQDARTKAYGKTGVPQEAAHPEKPAPEPQQKGNASRPGN
jgi:hypothetical protein